MSNGTPKATERSEGGSTKPRTPKRTAVLTERFMFRLDKATLVELEQYAAERHWTAAQAARLLIRNGLNTPPPVELEREPFEDSP